MKLFPHWQFLAAPLTLFYLGVFFNFLCCSANQSAMPVHEATIFWYMAAKHGILYNGGEMTDTIHRVMQPSDHLKFLADWISTPDGIASPGDLCIWASEYLTPLGWAAYLALVWKDSK